MTITAGALASDTPAPAAFRAVQVLETLAARRGPATITEVASATHLAKSSVCNLLVTLEAAGMVRRTHGGWVVGYKAIEIGQSVQITVRFERAPEVTVPIRIIDPADALEQINEDTP